ncbi:MAG: hypothetical protein EZS28_026453 [Streblomastix strix]|uniref:Uncharacterized protein n=1 Tax=Streblomastix strix TaxID=222440 RepID=A0A5J4V5B1_9EUKA|nr:MAG: hypothetical protein EZS28_026453 [Streblomastix strix]
MKSKETKQAAAIAVTINVFPPIPDLIRSSPPNSTDIQQSLGERYPLMSTGKEPAQISPQDDGKDSKSTASAKGAKKAAEAKDAPGITDRKAGQVTKSDVQMKDGKKYNNFW